MTTAQDTSLVAGLDRRAALKAAGAALSVSALPLAATGAQAQSPAATTPAAVARPRRTPDGDTFTRVLAAYAARTSMQGLPAEVRERAKKVIFDEMACAYFGRSSPAGRLIAQYIARFEGPREARIYGVGTKASLPYAALANGTAGHGYEVDGAHVVGGHPGASIVHAATATAEQQRATGSDLINAVVLGYDVGVRMVEACGGLFSMSQGRHLQSDYLYAFGCCAAAARLMQLPADRIAHSWALTSFQANGLNALFSEKHHISKSFCNGQYAFAGVSGALLAQTGLEGNEDIIGAPDGLLDAWGAPGRDTAVVEGLGSQFKIMGANFKFYNAGYPIHAALEASEGLIARDKIATASIAAIEIGMPRDALKVVDNRAMHNICVQDMVVADIVAGGLKLADEPFPGMLDNPNFKRLRGVISAGIDAELEHKAPEGRGARVTIVTLDGKRHSLLVENPRGHSLRGEISWDDLAKKWQGSLPNCDVTAAIATARRLETLPSADDLFEHFGGKSV